MDNLVSNTREKQIEKLKQDKKKLQTMNEEKWNKKYKLAKVYYEHYGNLDKRNPNKLSTLFTRVSDKI